MLSIKFELEAITLPNEEKPKLIIEIFSINSFLEISI